ncbi:hypothetical protein DWG14_06154 [Streptomyces griseorubiginosus]|uniref:Uncharacterized protein n=1 Tax=Streptomyces griseorubiginosus TaxID=67304 RepID=A0AAI8L5R9_9ACTN|nr:hypothetical protein DWG14_06154 [Streptomyces griseorubiginosus]
MKRVARWARAEWGPLYVTVRAHVLRRRWRAVPLAVTAVCLTLTLHVVHNQPWGYDVVQDVGAVRAADPLWLALLRTPLSLFVPALDLPVWGALVQILFVFGIAEICLGRWRTLALAYAATLAGTLYARVGVSLGPHHPFGLAATDAHVVDTGPSAAVVGLAVFLGWRYGARVTAGAVIVAMVIEVVAKENLAGREHLAAIAAMLLLCALSAARRRRGGRVGGGGARNAGAGSGAGSGVSDDGSGVPRTDSEGGAGSSAGGGGEPRGRIGTRAGAGAQRGTGTGHRRGGFGHGVEAGAGAEAEAGAWFRARTRAATETRPGKKPDAGSGSGLPSRGR